jgi:UDP-GlcNAc3NAcA epimerase
MRILTVIGARPQFIKAAPVSAAFAAAGLDEVVVHTGQHYDERMSDVFFAELGMSLPSHNLGIGSGPHGQQTAAMLVGVEDIINTESPDALMVYGDTNSTIAAALAAAKLHIPVIHVEAGLRSFNREMPEEINRVVTDHLSTLLFAPTESAVKLLAAEGITAGVLLVGDVMFDATLLFAGRSPGPVSAIVELQLDEREYVLATVHRAENTDSPERLEAILSALTEIGRQMPVILPLHPRTRAIIGDRSIDGVHLIEPVGYLEMVQLEAGAAVIVTDSGGVQKEAFFHGVPCVTVRHETEWTELVDLGWNRLAAPDSAEAIVAAVHDAAGTQGDSAKPYGDGDAANKLVAIIQAEIPGSPK